jgi:hypothetical protein
MDKKLRRANGLSLASRGDGTGCNPVGARTRNGRSRRKGEIGSKVAVSSNQLSALDMQEELLPVDCKAPNRWS